MNMKHLHVHCLPNSTVRAYVYTLWL